MKKRSGCIFTVKMVYLKKYIGPGNWQRDKILIVDGLYFGNFTINAEMLIHSWKVFIYQIILDGFILL